MKVICPVCDGTGMVPGDFGIGKSNPKLTRKEREKLPEKTCPACDGTGMQYGEPERKESIIIKCVPCPEPIGWPCPKKPRKPYDPFDQHPNIPKPWKIGDPPYNPLRTGDPPYNKQVQYWSSGKIGGGISRLNIR